jgi:hypothetical protein
MAKMTRNDLKSLVKECLFEILLESTNSSEQMVETKRTISRKSKSSAPSRPVLDKIENNKSTPELDVSSITSDPVMAAIFKDTARTTLVEQTKAERMGPQSGAGDSAARAAAASDPNDLFGDASKNWAALAFND